MKEQNCDCSSVELVVDWKSEKITNSVHCSVTLLWDESCAITTIGLNQPKKVQLYHLLKIQNSSHGESLKGGQWFFQQSNCCSREMLLFRSSLHQLDSGLLWSLELDSFFGTRHRDFGMIRLHSPMPRSFGIVSLVGHSPFSRKNERPYLNISRLSALSHLMWATNFIHKKQTFSITCTLSKST